MGEEREKRDVFTAEVGRKYRVSIQFDPGVGCDASDDIWLSADEADQLAKALVAVANGLKENES
jgi:hypothetical protein